MVSRTGMTGPRDPGVCRRKWGIKRSLPSPRPSSQRFQKVGGQNIHGNGANLNQKAESCGTSDPGKSGSHETGIPLLLLNLPPETFQEVQKIAQAGTPGVTTARITDPEMQSSQACREVEVEAGFVCKKCRMAYQTETGLLGHQRNICYPGKLSESRGSVRLVSISYECKHCSPTFATPSATEFKRHCESESHLGKVNQQQRLMKTGFAQQMPQSPSSGLTHEMENVVNQITALAAQAAQESTTPPSASMSQDSNANFTLKNSHSKDFCQQEPSKMNLVNSHVPIHSLGH